MKIRMTLEELLAHYEDGVLFFMGEIEEKFNGSFLGGFHAGWRGVDDAHDMLPEALDAYRRGFVLGGKVRRGKAPIPSWIRRKPVASPKELSS